MKVDVYNIEGKSTGRQVDLPDHVFGIEPNEHAVYLSIKQYNAHQRQGTHKAKERGEVSFSTKKLFRQKGTGGARRGSRRSPLLKGGGTTFGPRPRNYTIRLNKKVKSLARSSALSAKLNSGNLVVVEDFTFDSPKTKEYKKVLSNFEALDAKSLLVSKKRDNHVYLSSRNLKNAGYTAMNELNTHHVVSSEKVFITEGAIENFK